jgi:photosystem II stability/assembly factor-like uncharacterized protein
MILKTTNGGTNWSLLNTGTTEAIRSLYFVDANTGYAVGGYTSGGVILKTTNAGATWTSQVSGSNKWLNSVYFTDMNTGYAVGGESTSGKVVKTTNGGQTGPCKPFLPFMQCTGHIF